MRRGRGGLFVLAIVPLALAAVSLAGTPAASLFYEQGLITALSAAKLTVQADGQIPLTCARGTGSPGMRGFKVGDVVMIDCDQGVLARIAKPAHTLGSPTISILGLVNRFAVGTPFPGPSPTKAQCAAAWNATAPLPARQAIGALSPLGALVSLGSADRDAPTTQAPSQGPFCQISFVLAGQSSRTATVSSFWKHGEPEGWAGFIDHTGARFFLSADQTEFASSTAGTLSLR